MIAGIFHKGSGLGNQLHRYVAARLLAKKESDTFGMVAPDLFKGASFMKLNMGYPITDYTIEYPAGKVIPNTDATVIDGEFQGQEVWKDHIEEIRDWLAVEPLDMPDDLCVINFRGGEYVGVADLFLPHTYWDKAISDMKKINPLMRFEIHTDDPDTARRFFPDIHILGDMETNWRSIRYAKHLILSNSSFAILPAHLNENVKEIIAPSYWAGHNINKWLNPDNNYSKFIYI